MAKGYPSMLALLGLVAVAGYQNRDKIAEMVGKLGHDPQHPQPGQPAAWTARADRSAAWATC